MDDFRIFEQQVNKNVMLLCTSQHTKLQLSRNERQLSPQHHFSSSDLHQLSAVKNRSVFVQKRLSCSYAGVCLCEVCLPDVLLSLQAVIWSTKLLSVPGCWLLSLMRPVDPLIHKLDYTYKQLFFLHFRGHYKGLHTYIQRRLKFEVLKHTLSLGNFIFRLWPALQSKFNILR